ncbi:MFS transporter [Jiangella alkaliphila]|uniref:Predicted arabinose efflux permease, MFS family n=1 Tax=Jiangella alkaliphila TaxID=419479 RepID=A0A1H2KXJ8_9ACTN|nr:MFS transporter [Jiangella alkaliphila]SDU73081.1 Predicted arabinose efflux permease, MFS family [Jiangella alkaliphila]
MAGWREVFGVPEFRTLWLAQTQSRVGDQLARVALALLVYERTDSAGLTALVYALTLLPPLVTAPLLAGLADRYSRRTVMVAVDVARAAFAGLMAIPGMPLPLLAALVVAMTCLQPLFAAARNATLPSVLTGDRFAVGLGIVTATDGLAQVAGFTAGGLVVVWAGGPNVALAANAVTFLLSAALLRWGLRPHRPGGADGVPARRPSGFALAGVRLVVGDRRLLGLVSLIWLFGLYLAPEALAAPYAAQIGAGTSAVGLLMAADVAGSVVGAALVTRVRPPWRDRLTVPLAVAAGLPLVATVAGPPLPVTVALWALSGLLATYMVLAQVTFTEELADEVRGRAIGFASAGLQSAQGVGVLLAGGLAELMPPSVAVAACAAAGSLGAVLIWATLLRARDGTGPAVRRTEERRNHA